MKKELIKKIIEKKDFSELPLKDVELAFAKFDKLQYLDEEKIKLTRDLLRKVFSAFTSKKILSLKDKDAEWILRKHLSTRERLPYYSELYGKIFSKTKKKISVIDLGAGINGFSYEYFLKEKLNVNYVAVEAMGQLVSLMNDYFSKNKFNAKAVHLSLFEFEKVKKIIQKQKGEKIIFLFKVLDSLEMIERDYSKKLLLEIVPLSEKVVVSFATRSMLKRRKFKFNRNWILDFIKNNFNVLDDFELGGEIYIILQKGKKSHYA